MMGATVLSQNEEGTQRYVKERGLNVFPALQVPEFEIYGELHKSILSFMLACLIFTFFN